MGSFTLLQVLMNLKKKTDKNLSFNKLKKKVLSGSTELLDFAFGLDDSIFHLP